MRHIGSNIQIGKHSSKISDTSERGSGAGWEKIIGITCTYILVLYTYLSVEMEASSTFFFLSSSSRSKGDILPGPGDSSRAVDFTDNVPSKSWDIKEKTKSMTTTTKNFNSKDTTKQ